MVPRWAEGVFGDEPTGWEDDEVGDCGARVVGGAGEDGEDGRVGMVVGDAADGVEAAEVVFIGIVCSVPGDDVERSVVLEGGEEAFIEFADDSVGGGGGDVMNVGSCRGFEVPGVGKTVRPDGSE